MTERPKLRRWISLDDARALLDRFGTEADLVEDPDEIGPTTRDSDDDYRRFGFHGEVGVMVGSRSQFGLPAWSRVRIR